jgi:hypothetical protein
MPVSTGNENFCADGEADAAVAVGAVGDAMATSFQKAPSE